MQAVVTTVRQARSIVSGEGLGGLIRAAWGLLRRNLPGLTTFDIYEYSLDGLDQIRVGQPPADLHVAVVTGASPPDGDGARQALVNFDRWAARKLARGAEAVCLLAGEKLVSFIWVATNQAARDAIDPWRYEVDLAHGQACTAGMFTVPEARGAGLAKIGLLTAFRHLAGEGMTSVRHAIAVDNQPSQRLHAHFSPRRVGRVRGLHAFGCTLSWRITAPDSP